MDKKVPKLYILVSKFMQFNNYSIDQIEKFWIDQA